MPEPATRITSLQNDRVKFIRSLEMRKARRASGLFVAEGASLLITARDNGWTPKTLVTGPAADASDAARGLTVWAHKAGAECLEVSAAVLEKLASKDNPQSLMGVFEQRWTALPDGKAPEQVGAAVRTAKANAASVPLWLALEEIRDPGNLGTIIRTADAAGVSGIILAGQTCDPYSHEAVRASMGSTFSVPLARTDRDGLLALAKSWPGGVVGTHLSGSVDFRAARYQAPVLLIMGNEGAGLSPDVTAACRQLVRIPMAGKLDSLNLAVATALMLYEIRRPSLTA